MKLLSVVLSVFLILTLCGCHVKEDMTLECVCDQWEEIAAPAFYIEADIPAEAPLAASCREGCCVVFAHPDYEIIEEIFTAESEEAAFYHVAGASRDALNPIQIPSHPHPKYRFAWSAMGDTGELICSTSLTYDGTHYYAVTIRCNAQAEERYREVFSELLSGVTLVRV